MPTPTNETVARASGFPDTESSTTPTTFTGCRLNNVSVPRRITTSSPPVVATSDSRILVDVGESFVSTGMRISHAEITTAPSGSRVKCIPPPAA